MGLSLCEIAHASRNMCMCDKFFFFFFFWFTWFSLSRCEITCANRLCKQFFLFLFLFLLDMILVMIFFFFFGSPIPQKRTNFLDLMWEVPSWYRIVFKVFQIERSRQRRIMRWNTCTFLVGSNLIGSFVQYIMSQLTCISHCNVECFLYWKCSHVVGDQLSKKHLGHMDT